MSPTQFGHFPMRTATFLEKSDINPRNTNIAKPTGGMTKRRTSEATPNSINTGFNGRPILPGLVSVHFLAFWTGAPQCGQAEALSLTWRLHSEHAIKAMYSPLYVSSEGNSC